MRTSLRLFAPALRNAAASSRASSSKTKLFVGAVAGGTLAYALVPHKQTLLLESGPSGRRVRSAWEDPPPKPAEVPEEQQQSASESPLDGPNEASQAAFDPVTGEINWDCPCLGGMAHGPCGPQFREAFSCFINSEDEPKGINCVEKFKSMQDCFRAHPDVYGEEIDDDDSHKHHGDASLEDLVKEAETALAEPNSPESTENVKKFASSSTPQTTKPVSKETTSTPVPTSASS